MRCRRNLRFVSINELTVKLVSLYAVSLKLSEPMFVEGKKASLTGVQQGPPGGQSPVPQSLCSVAPTACSGLAVRQEPVSGRVRQDSGEGVGLVCLCGVCLRGPPNRVPNPPLSHPHLCILGHFLFPVRRIPYFSDREGCRTYAFITEKCLPLGSCGLSGRDLPWVEKFKSSLMTLYVGMSDRYSQLRITAFKARAQTPQVPVDGIP